MVKIGNLFELAERRLIREKELGLIPCFTMLDIIEYAVIIRKFLDKHRVKRIMTLTKKELEIQRVFLRRKRYLRNEARC